MTAEPNAPNGPELVDIAALEATWAQRRSIRGFLPEPIPRSELERMFAAAQRAPSWCNVQPWRVVVTEPPTPRKAIEGTDG